MKASPVPETASIKFYCAGKPEFLKNQAGKIT